MLDMLWKLEVRLFHVPVLVSISNWKELIHTAYFPSQTDCVLQHSLDDCVSRDVLGPQATQ